MNQVVQEVLTKSALLALENWGMMLVEPAENDCNAFPLNHQPILTTMQFRGVMNGTIAVLGAREFAESLCRNLESKDSDEEVSFDECCDALKELCNVISGNLLTEAYGDDTVFDLVYPAIKPISADLLAKFFSNKLTLTFSADDYPIAVAVGPLDFI